jgi:RNase P/RNase MRP subunit p29
MHQGRAPWTEKDKLRKILSMYQELRDRGRIVTLNIITAELKRLDRSVQGPSLGAIRHRVWRHIKKHGIVRRHVTHVAQKTHYEQSGIQGWVSYVNHTIKIGNYKACDVLNIDETKVEFDLTSGTTLAGHGE